MKVLHATDTLKNGQDGTFYVMCILLQQNNLKCKTIEFGQIIFVVASSLIDYIVRGQSNKKRLRESWRIMVRAQKRERESQAGALTREGQRPENRSPTDTSRLCRPAKRTQICLSMCFNPSGIFRGNSRPPAPMGLVLAVSKPPGAMRAALLVPIG